MLRNHCQPCGGRGALCYATLPPGLVPLITRSISVKCILSLARVADCLPKNSRFPDIFREHLFPRAEQKVANSAKPRVQPKSQKGLSHKPMAAIT